MEDVLSVYTRLHDPDRPLVCLDETTKQLTKETRTPVPMKKGQPARVDYEYERNGTANMFMMFAPLEGWRHVKVTERRTAIDYAQVLKDLSDVHFPTPRPSSWSRTISTPTHRRRSARRFRLRKPAVWLSVSNGITPRNTEAGSTWPNPNSASSPPNASIVASQTVKPSLRKWPRGSAIAIATTPKPTGTSQPKRPASNSSTCTRHFE
jgi:hypothetical protein